jgi:hypothetical protein
MKRESHDFHTVRPEHFEIHDRLLNWARVVRVHMERGSDCGPLFKHYRTSSYSFDKQEAQWVSDEPRRDPPDMLAGWKLEKHMRNLPTKERGAIKWHYIEPARHPAKAAYRLSVTQLVLAQLVHNGRTMLKNRA